MKTGKAKADWGKFFGLTLFLKEKLGCQVQITRSGDGYDLAIKKIPAADSKIHVTDDNLDVIVTVFWDAWHLGREYERDHVTNRLQDSVSAV
jgi:hypothetical protein